MANNLHHMKKAAEILNKGLGSPKETLIKGGTEFWAALKYPEQWPPDLLEEADRICEVLLADGTIKTTVAEMNRECAVQTLERLRVDIADLAAKLEQAKRPGRPPKPDQTASGDG